MLMIFFINEVKFNNGIQFTISGNDFAITIVTYKTNPNSMKKIISIMLSPVILFVMLLQFNALPLPKQDRIALPLSERAGLSTTVVTNGSETIGKTSNHFVSKKTYNSVRNKSEDIIAYAFSLLGTPYLYAGITKENGFDCSGFTTHVFDINGVSIKRSSELQSTEGYAVNRSEAAPGDLVIFTGTDRTVREPGHVGIVISQPGDTIEFIHSSSNGGVKVSQVEGTGYEARFLDIRRVL